MVELVAKAKMLIQRPAVEVFDAFVQPSSITRFWLARTTGPLGINAEVEWEFLVPGATERVSVKSFVEPRHIAFVWLKGKLNVDIRISDEDESISTVSVEVRGFEPKESSLAQVVNATEGFAIVLCDLKTFLESGRSANLVRDKAALIHREQAS